MHVLCVVHHCLLLNLLAQLLLLTASVSAVDSPVKKTGTVDGAASSCCSSLTKLAASATGSAALLRLMGSTSSTPDRLDFCWVYSAGQAPGRVQNTTCRCQDVLVDAAPLLLPLLCGAVQPNATAALSQHTIQWYHRRHCPSALKKQHEVGHNHCNQLATVMLLPNGRNHIAAAVANNQLHTCQRLRSGGVRWQHHDCFERLCLCHWQGQILQQQSGSTQFLQSNSIRSSS